MPSCKKASDCERFGGAYVCQDSACVAAACAADGDTQTIEEPSTPTSDVDGVTTNQSTTLPDGGSGQSSLESSAIGTSSENEQSGVVPVACDPTIDEVSERPYWERLELEPELTVGEPGCEGACGYVLTFDEDDDLLWQHDPKLVCPLRLDECGALRAVLDENPARCNTVEDCVSFQGETSPCEPAFDRVKYFDSALFTSDERQAREGILAQLEARGCRTSRVGEWDGPLFSLGCVDNLCQLVEDGNCLDGRESDGAETNCPAMDVADTGEECPAVPVSYWNGSECVTAQWCRCQGEDCAETFTHNDDCLTHYAACIEDVPTCSGEIELEEVGDLGAFRPSFSPFYFGVVGEEPGQYEEDPTTAPLADFTLAEWRGTESADAGVAQTLTFLVEGEPHVFSFYFGSAGWPLPAAIAGLEVGTIVDVRVVREGGEPVQLQVRDMREVPLFWFVQDAPTGQTTQWSFGELSARVAAPICKRVEETCNWLFTLNELAVAYGASEATLGQMESQYVGVANEQGPSYAILNSHNFSNNQAAYDDEICAAAMPRHDGFVIWRDDERDDE